MIYFVPAIACSPDSAASGRGNEISCPNCGYSFLEIVGLLVENVFISFENGI